MRDAGAGDPGRAAAASAVIRAAAATDAAVDIIAPGELPLAGSAGGLLRFTL